jgi:hypothetical protein
MAALVIASMSSVSCDAQRGAGTPGHLPSEPSVQKRVDELLRNRVESHAAIDEGPPIDLPEASPVTTGPPTGAGILRLHLRYETGRIVKSRDECEVALDDAEQLAVTCFSVILRGAEENGRVHLRARELGGSFTLRGRVFSTTRMGGAVSGTSAESKLDSGQWEFMQEEDVQ